MHLPLTKEQILIQNMARQFDQNELAANAVALDEHCGKKSYLDLINLPYTQRIIDFYFNDVGRFVSVEGLDDLSRYMYVSPRTLRRHLKNEGQSYLGIMNSLRAQVACEWLKGSEIKIDDIACKMGYAEASSFIRAFKQWTGITPRQYRNSL